MDALRVLFDRPKLLAMNLGLFGLGTLVATERFRILLGLANVRVSFRALYPLQMTAYFFNVVIPGNIGGDVVKALYVARDEPKEKRTTIVLLAFVERLIGVAALVLMAAIIMLVRPSVWSDPLLRPFAVAVMVIGTGTFLGGTLALVIVQMAGRKLDQYTSGPTRLSKLLNRLVGSMRLLAADPRRLLVALGLSMVQHAFAMFYFTMLTDALLQRSVPFAAVSTVFPLGLLSLMLPISPAGVGVGHLVFKHLFQAIGLPSGATVFNVYLFGQITPCLLGVFPFLALKRRGALVTEVPPDAPPAS